MTVAQTSGGGGSFLERVGGFGQWERRCNRRCFVETSNCICPLLWGYPPLPSKAAVALKCLKGVPSSTAMMYLVRLLTYSILQ